MSLLYGFSDGAGYLGQKGGERANALGPRRLAGGLAVEQAQIGPETALDGIVQLQGEGSRGHGTGWNTALEGSALLCGEYGREQKYKAVSGTPLCRLHG